MNINQWVGCGRLTKDAEASVTQKGTSMSKFRLAVNDRRSDDTLFLNVLCSGKMFSINNSRYSVTVFRIRLKIVV